MPLGDFAPVDIEMHIIASDLYLLNLYANSQPLLNQSPSELATFFEITSQIMGCGEMRGECNAVRCGRGKRKIVDHDYKLHRNCLNSLTKMNVLIPLERDRIEVLVVHCDVA